MRTTLALGIALAATAANATVHDLATDFSGTVNPNGVWRLEKDVGVLFTTSQPDYWSNGSNQAAWADDPFALLKHVPVWLKVTTLNVPGGASGFALGDVLVHGSEPDRSGSVNTSAVWTSPIDGSVVVTGDTWFPSDLGRVVDIEFRKNGALLSRFRLTGIFTRANRLNFASASGGLFALTQDVAVGDRIEVRFFTPIDPPNFAGVNFTVDATAGVDTETLSPVAEAVLLGTANSGGNLASWATDDGNQRRVCRFVVPFAGSPFIRINLDYVTTKTNPSRILFGVEAAMETAGLFAVRLYNQRKTDSVFVESLANSTINTTGFVFTGQPGGNLADYIGSGGAMRSRIEVQQTGPTASLSPCTVFDFAQMKVSE
jgi:hypothetical protein